MKNARALKLKVSKSKASKSKAVAKKKSSANEKPTKEKKSAQKKALPPAKKPSKAELKAQKVAVKAKELQKKQDELSKKAHSNPWDPFFELWKPKTESFDAGIDKFLSEYPPAADSKDFRTQLIEKIHQQMRRHTLSPSIEEQLFERFPRDRVHKLSSIFSMKPKTTIRLNFLRADIRGFEESQAAKDLKIKKSTLSPWGFEVGKAEDLRSHPSFGRGLYEVQDESDQILSLLVNARPGQRILTLNSGTGDVPLALATMMKNTGSLFVYEADAKNQKAFKESAQRAQLDNYRILSDSQIGEVKSLDSVLIQAPSSHLGGLGHHPDLKWRFFKEDLPRLHKLQAALLREAGRKLKLGGYIIYATHTLNKSENEAQIDHFIRSSHNSFRVVSMNSHIRDFVLPYMNTFYGFQWDEKTLASLSEYDPFFVLSPDVHGTSGMFVSVIQRIRISS